MKFTQNKRLKAIPTHNTTMELAVYDTEKGEGKVFENVQHFTHNEEEGFVDVEMKDGFETFEGDAISLEGIDYRE